MDPMTWQIIAAVAVALILIGLAAWLFMRQRRGVGTTGAGTHDLHTRYSELQAEVTSLRDRHDLLDQRVDRFDRTSTDSAERVAAIREDFESRMSRYDALDQRMREIQEQIYEVRQEHKVLMERDERHERRVNELQEQLSEVRTEVPSRPGNGDRRRVKS